MKKNLLKLLVIAILCAIITLFFCFCSIKYNSSFTSFTTIEQVINEIKESTCIGAYKNEIKVEL